MKASRIPVLFHSFSLLCFLWLKPCFGLSLKEAFSEHFLVGTIWHGYSVDGEKNKFLAQEKALTATEFNVITPENCMKPSFTQPKEGIFTFAEGDDLVAFAQEHSIAVVGHTLVWKNDAPQWFFKDAAGGEVSREVLIERMKEHIRTVVGRYRGRIAYWDVVNEAIDTNWIQQEQRFDAFYKPCPWLDIIGPEYIEIAYRTAHEADPDAKLLYNDYNLDQPAKLDFALDMIAGLRKRGVPIHGLGYQGHFFLDEPTLPLIERVLENSRKAGVPLHITELDVSVLPNAWKHRGASVEDKFELAAEFNPYVEGAPEPVLLEQANRYEDLFNLFVQYADNMERVSFWGVWDGNSWRDYRPMLGRTDYPLLIGREFERKPAYHAVIKMAEAR
ncbi:MAG: endo-1,4-beta-xylanase [Coraliomargarita sp. TMED73]|nr:MAG: endo-1,4-beta-xylanase [Coraliomargarita sp. TMED73]|tara:strand:- start:801 stop:1964 length:1164 start_codon:yes stop_codon:yes gene_type:complete